MDSNNQKVQVNPLNSDTDDKDCQHKEPINVEEANVVDEMLI